MAKDVMGDIVKWLTEANILLYRLIHSVFIIKSFD